MLALVGTLYAPLEARLHTPAPHVRVLSHSSPLLRNLGVVFRAAANLRELMLGVISERGQNAALKTTGTSAHRLPN